MAVNFQQWPMADLLPHAGNMILLERVEYCDDDSIVVIATPDADTILLDAAGVLPAWAGIEYMAQAIACFAGVHERLHGRPPKVGFLLGTRSYDSKVAAFAPGKALRITASKQYQETNGLGAFQCRIEDETGLLVEASINVFEPPELEQYLSAQHQQGTT